MAFKLAFVVVVVLLVHGTTSTPVERDVGLDVGDVVDAVADVIDTVVDAAAAAVPVVNGADEVATTLESLPDGVAAPADSVPAADVPVEVTAADTSAEDEPEAEPPVTEPPTTPAPLPREFFFLFHFRELRAQYVVGNRCLSTTCPSKIFQFRKKIRIFIRFRRK